MIGSAKKHVVLGFQMQTLPAAKDVYYLDPEVKKPPTKRY